MNISMTMKLHLFICFFFFSLIIYFFSLLSYEKLGEIMTLRFPFMLGNNKKKLARYCQKYINLSDDDVYTEFFISACGFFSFLLTLIFISFDEYSFYIQTYMYLFLNHFVIRLLPQYSPTQSYIDKITVTLPCWWAYEPINMSTILMSKQFTIEN